MCANSAVTSAHSEMALSKHAGPESQIGTRLDGTTVDTITNKESGNPTLLSGD
jgi:hypothetical protein